MIPGKLILRMIYKGIGKTGSVALASYSVSLSPVSLFLVGVRQQYFTVVVRI